MNHWINLICEDNLFAEIAARLICDVEEWKLTLTPLPYVQGHHARPYEIYIGFTYRVSGVAYLADHSDHIPAAALDNLPLLGDTIAKLFNSYLAIRHKSN